MNAVRIAALSVVCLLFTAAASLAQDSPSLSGVEVTSVSDAARLLAAKAPKGALSDLRAVGAGLVIIGAAVGIGWLARSAVESMARQPEAAASIQTAMIIAAALIEGVTFFALIIIMLFVTPY
jgi:F-type H+-transporting ATPase subunit c